MTAHDARPGAPRLAAALVACIALVAFTLPAPADAQTLAYPETANGEVVDTFFGTPVPDPYRWLEDTDAPEVHAWVEAQNEVTFGYLDRIAAREPLRARLTELWNYERVGAPFREGGRYFHFRNDGLQDQSVLYVRESLDAEPRTLVDPNALSEDGTVALSGLGVSHDGRYLGYGLSEAGSDWQTLHVRDIETGADLEDVLRWVKFSPFAWTHDARGFFYSRYPEPEGDELLAESRFRSVYYHALGQPQLRDRLIYERPDQPDWSFSPSVTDDGRWALIYGSAGTAEEDLLYVIDLGEPGRPELDAPIVKLIDAFEASYSVIGSDGPVLYLRTDLAAPLGRVIAIDLREAERVTEENAYVDDEGAAAGAGDADPVAERRGWRVIVPEREHVLRGAQIVGGRIVARYLEDAKSRVRFYTLDGDDAGTLPLEGIGSVGALSGEPDRPELFYTFQSFLEPGAVYRYDLDTGEQELFHRPDVDFDASRYVTKQVFYTSKDGTRVPMFITHRRGIELDGSNPTYLYGYGGFNIALSPGFSVENAVWLELGGVYAMPNLRGGGEYGESWHQAGTKMRKQNVFDDFIAAAEYLIDEGYTRRDKLAIGGGSNGGLLVGAVMTQRPELFGVAHPAVGVMDMLRYHEFTVGWGWAPDYGTAEDGPEMFQYLHGYSPYHNLRPGICYPPTLVTTADHDDRVVPGHSFKFAARLQRHQSCDNPALIRIETRAGHGAGKPTSKRIEEAADRLGFRVHELGVALPASFRTAAR